MLYLSRLKFFQLLKILKTKNMMRNFYCLYKQYTDVVIYEDSVGKNNLKDENFEVFIVFAKTDVMVLQ